MIRNLAYRLRHDRRAVAAVEYAIICGVAAVLVVTGFTTLYNGVGTAFLNIVKSL